MYNNYNQQLQFLDYLNIASFCIGLLNLDQNLTQNDKQELVQELNNQLQATLNDIHAHLAEQDKKIDLIMAALGVKYDDR